MSWVAVALGGAAGAVLRVLLAGWLGGGRATPGSVAAVNLGGSFLAGLAVGASDRWPQWLTLTLVTGLLGALTTYSTWGVDVVALWRGGARGRALLLAGGLLLAGVAAAWLGLRVGGGVLGS